MLRCWSALDFVAVGSNVDLLPKSLAEQHLFIWKYPWGLFRIIWDLALGTIRPQGVVCAAARALDDQQVDVAFSQLFAAVLAAQFGERLGGRYSHGWPSRGRPARSASQRELISKYSGESSTPV